jgi:hypothetical protein
LVGSHTTAVAGTVLTSTFRTAHRRTHPNTPPKKTGVLSSTTVNTIRAINILEPAFLNGNFTFIGWKTDGTELVLPTEMCARGNYM